MKYPKEVRSVIHDLSNAVSAVEMELHLLEVQQLEIQHAINACERAVNLSKALRQLLAGEDDEQSGSKGG